MELPEWMALSYFTGQTDVNGQTIDELGFAVA
jgi:hypothetical protein